MRFNISWHFPTPVPERRVRPLQAVLGLVKSEETKSGMIGRQGSLLPCGAALQYHPFTPLISPAKQRPHP